MKKNYIAPQIEAIELLGANAIMSGSGFVSPNVKWGGSDYNGQGQ